MKKLSSYLPSLILSVIITFMFILSASAVVISATLTPNAANQLADEKNVTQKIMTQLDRSYREKQNITGIPASLYNDSVSSDYVKSVVKAYIDEGFRCLKTGDKFLPAIPKNEKLEGALDKFFNDYADEGGYEKNDAFDQKLANTKKNAYDTIGTACDIYRFKTISDNGVTSKLSKIYKLRLPLTAASLAGLAVMLVILFLVNKKEKKTMLYWTGVSASVSGVLMFVPSAYLRATKYFNAFSIKQPQVFSAYTGMMFNLTDRIMASAIALLAAGVIMIVFYLLINKKEKDNTSQKSAKADKSAEISSEEK